MIKLVRLAGGGFDVAMDDSSEPAGAAQTVVYALLYTDGRAPLAREADEFLARGWWADEQAGSGLWHVRRQALSAGARTETVQMVRDALDRMPALTGLSVLDVTPAGNVSGLQLQIKGQHNERQFLLDLTL